jgi:riboflavin kinase/FMN adenylyltransferase
VKVLRGDPEYWRPEGPHVVTVGVFDGVHLGHRHLIDRVRAEAAERGVGAGLVTFDSHPLAFLAPMHAPEVLTSLERRLELFEEAGVDTVGVLPFGESVRAMSPTEFVRVALVDGMGAVVVLAGEDFRFGKDRAGDVEVLRLLGVEFGFEVEEVALVDGNGPLSSTHIRRLIAAGDVEEAAEALGRPFELRGRLVPGPRHGGPIGTLTASVEVESGVAVPGRGVYAARAALASSGPVTAVVDIGVRPAYGGDRETVDVHLAGVDGDLSGTEVRLEFHARIRGEHRFEGPDEMARQIGLDMEAARRLLG